MAIGTSTPLLESSRISPSTTACAVSFSALVVLGTVGIVLMVVGVLGLLLSFKVVRVLRDVGPWCQVGRRPEALGSQAVDGLVRTPGPVWAGTRGGRP